MVKENTKPEIIYERPKEGQQLQTGRNIKKILYYDDKAETMANHQPKNKTIPKRLDSVAEEGNGEVKKDPTNGGLKIFNEGVFVFNL
jgi:hypothetical protein